MYRWVNDGITSLQVKEKDIQLYIDKGYKFGIAKKEVMSMNKSITTRTRYSICGSDYS